MRYLSVCSGIEAASVAWHPLGWEPVGFSEIEPFPSAVLAHRFPNVPNYGDMTQYKEWPLEPGSVDLLVGGTPCQSFSVAGLRKGLDDPRGNLALVFLGIADRLRPRWVVWENVPGVLSSSGGRDFGSFLGALGELGYGWAYRVLDAQYVRTHSHPHAVPQRRRRVFVVGCLGDAASARAVLFERESLRGVFEAPKTSTASPETIVRSDDGEAWCMTCDVEYQYCGCIGHEALCLDCGEWTSGLHYEDEDGCQHCGAEASWFPRVTGTLSDGAHNGGGLNGQDAYTGRIIVHAGLPRRLTPTECERLQGFPDGWTNVPWRKKDESPDGPRYKALGNSMAVNVMRWIGDRIAEVEAINMEQS
jgi:DNA (cytosine-5)-methyltransferase 1